MEKLEENNWLYGLLIGGLSALIGIIIFPLLDIFIAKFITHGTYVYSFQNYFVQPIIFGIIFGLSIALIKKKKRK